MERGLELEKKDRRRNRSAWHLPHLKRDILKKLGRTADALASAWDDYRRAPSLYSYDDLMRFVPKADRAEWRAKALGALDGVNLSSRIDLLLKTKECERLAAAIEAAQPVHLAALSHSTTDRAAKRLEKAHPLLAAKLHVAMALRILDAKMSKDYDAALGNLEQARRLMLKDGQNEEWRALVDEIRESHRRKSGFMPGFERLVQGATTKEPSFLERARKRWDGGAGRTRGWS